MTSPAAPSVSRPSAPSVGIKRPRNAMQREVFVQLSDRTAAITARMDNPAAFATAEDQLAIEKDLWSLLLDIEPFLFLSLPQSHPYCESLPDSVRALREGVAHRDLSAARSAMRLYLVTANLMMRFPLAVAHVFIKTLALMPSLGDILQDDKHLDRYYAGFFGMLQRLCLDHSGGGRMLVEDFFDCFLGGGLSVSSGVFDPKTLLEAFVARRDGFSGDCANPQQQFTLALHPPASLTEGAYLPEPADGASQLFTARILVDTPIQAVSLSYGLCTTAVWLSKYGGMPSLSQENVLLLMGHLRAVAVASDFARNRGGLPHPLAAPTAALLRTRAATLMRDTLSCPIFSSFSPEAHHTMLLLLLESLERENYHCTAASRGTPTSAPSSPGSPASTSAQTTSWPYVCVSWLLSQRPADADHFRVVTVEALTRLSELPLAACAHTLLLRLSVLLSPGCVHSGTTAENCVSSAEELKFLLGVVQVLESVLLPLLTVDTGARFVTQALRPLETVIAQLAPALLQTEMYLPREASTSMVSISHLHPVSSILRFFEPDFLSEVFGAAVQAVTERSSAGAVPLLYMESVAAAALRSAADARTQVRKPNEGATVSLDFVTASFEAVFTAVVEHLKQKLQEALDYTLLLQSLTLLVSAEPLKAQLAVCSLDTHAAEAMRVVEEFVMVNKSQKLTIKAEVWCCLCRVCCARLPVAASFGCADRLHTTSEHSGILGHSVSGDIRPSADFPTSTLDGSVKRVLLASTSRNAAEHVAFHLSRLTGVLDGFCIRLENNSPVPHAYEAALFQELCFIVQCVDHVVSTHLIQSESSPQRICLLQALARLLQLSLPLLPAALEWRTTTVNDNIGVNAVTSGRRDGSARASITAKSAQPAAAATTVPDIVDVDVDEEDEGDGPRDNNNENEEDPNNTDCSHVALARDQYCCTPFVSLRGHLFCLYQALVSDMSDAEEQAVEPQCVEQLRRCFCLCSPFCLYSTEADQADDIDKYLDLLLSFMTASSAADGAAPDLHGCLVPLALCCTVSRQSHVERCATVLESLLPGKSTVVPCSNRSARPLSNGKDARDEFALDHVITTFLPLFHGTFVHSLCFSDQSSALLEVALLDFGFADSTWRRGANSLIVSRPTCLRLLGVTALRWCVLLHEQVQNLSDMDKGGFAAHMLNPRLMTLRSRLLELSFAILGSLDMTVEDVCRYSPGLLRFSLVHMLLQDSSGGVGYGAVLHVLDRIAFVSIVDGPSSLPKGLSSNRKSEAPTPDTGLSVFPKNTVEESFYLDPAWQSVFSDIMTTVVAHKADRPDSYLFSAALAQALYRPGVPCGDRLRDLTKVLQHFDHSLEDLPRLCRSDLVLIAFNIISLESDHQLDRYEQSLRIALDCADGIGELGVGAVSSPSGNRRHSAPHTQSPNGRKGSAVKFTSDPSKKPHTDEGNSLAAATSADSVKDRLQTVLECGSIQLELALRMAVTLSTSGTTKKEISEAINSPSSLDYARKELTNYIFAIFFTIEQQMGLKQERVSSRNDSSISVYRLGASSLNHMRRRWLAGLRSLLCFLGQDGTVIASKVPAILDLCVGTRSLTSLCVLVWFTLIQCCSEDYLQVHGAAILAELLCIEQLDSHLPDTATTFLNLSLTLLWDRTAKQDFWGPFFHVASNSSRILRRLQIEHTSPSNPTPHQQPLSSSTTRPRAAGRSSPTVSKTGRGTAKKRDDADTTSFAQDTYEMHAKIERAIDGFLRTVRSPTCTPKCKSVFTVAFHTYLRDMAVTERAAFTLLSAQHDLLIPTFLTLARELQDPEASLSALRCVGMIGAVSPTSARRDVSKRLGSAADVALPQANNHSNDPSPELQMLAELQHREFALEPANLMSWRDLAHVLLLTYCPAALNNTTVAQLHDHAAFAVQELLRVCADKERTLGSLPPLEEGTNPTVMELQRYTWWKKLPPQTQKMLDAFTTTNYHTEVLQAPSQPCPVYEEGKRFRVWLFGLYCSLSERCGDFLGVVCKRFRNVAKHDPALIQFLLPHMVAHVICCSEERKRSAAIESLALEFKALRDYAVKVSVSACAREDGTDKTTTAAGNRAARRREATMGDGQAEEVPHFSLRSQHVLEAHTSQGVSAAVDATSAAAFSTSNASSTFDDADQTNVWLHLQFMLHILEDVGQLRWRLLGLLVRSAKHVGEEPLDDRRCKDMSKYCAEFLASIPWHDKTLMSIDMGSFIRALRFVESQRHIPPTSHVVSTVPLQRIFASLDDRDSARSIHRLSHGLRPSEAAFSYENNGDWTLALQNCEMVLQHDPNSRPHQYTALRCMHHIGQLHLMSRYARSLLNDVAAKTGSDLRPPSAVTCAVGASATAPVTFTVADYRHAATLRSYANEAAWRLGEWDSVQPDPALPVSLAGPMQALMRFVDAPTGPTTLSSAPASQSMERGGEANLFAFEAVHQLCEVERAKLRPLVNASCREGYLQGYSVVSLLHALEDVELVCNFVKDQRRRATTPHQEDTKMSNNITNGAAGATLSNRSSVSPSMDDLLQCLQTRKATVRPSLEAREPLLAVHRAVYASLGLHREVSQTWLEHAQLLQVSGFSEAALAAAKQSDCSSGGRSMTQNDVNPKYFVIAAELLHEKNTPMEAIEFAQLHVKKGTLPPATLAHLQVLLTNWTLEIGSQSPKEVIESYQEALKLEDCELAHYHLALFYDKIFNFNHQNARSSTICSTASGGLYSAAGVRPNSGSLGALGTVGLGASASSSGSIARNGDAGSGRSSGLSLMEREDLVHRTATYAIPAIDHFGAAMRLGTQTVPVSLPRMLTLWLDTTAELHSFSGATTNSDRVHNALNDRIERLVLGSTDAVSPAIVVTALSQLLSRLQHPSPHVAKLITSIVVALMNHFPQQCLWMVLPIAFSEQTERATIARRNILDVFRAKQDKWYRKASVIFSALIAFCNSPAKDYTSSSKLTEQPFMQDALKILRDTGFIIPTMDNLSPRITTSVEDVFAGHSTFAGFHDRVQIMSSLQKPKRIWVWTDTGDTVSFLCKSKDEPRKDIRMMEIATLMNTIFARDPDASRRNFSLRRYSIAALTDDCAIIEWVSKIETIRGLMTHCYALDESGVSIKEVKAWYAKVEANTLSKLRLFKDYILPRARPVFHQWWDMSFPNNQAWYAARSLYTQSTALWSIAGHVVGLGDRHGDNLAIAVQSGEMIHVDFACMFDKGETLEVPERVRFRLTPNIVDAMGVLGAEGPFHSHCEVSLRCLMRNKNAIMSIAETLLHDPLVEWASNRGSRGVNPTELMTRVSRRLDGFLDLYTVPRERDTLTLNVEGQVSKLIWHSSAIENLSEMYIWWMAWL